MSPVEIVFVLLGVIILIASCFITGDKENKSEADVMVSDEVMEHQRQEISSYAERILSKKSEEVIVKTDDYLSKISNEKIMAVNDFTEQILEKIDANHKEVVFLYDMLNQKEDEIKQTVHQFNKEQQQMKEVVTDVIKLTKQLSSVAKKNGASDKTEAPEKRVVKQEAQKVKKKSTESVKATENKADGQMEFTEMLPADRQKEEVLSLYNQGKSILEISKTMGMGQGEVKLIIGIYGA